MRLSSCTDASSSSQSSSMYASHSHSYGAPAIARTTSSSSASTSSAAASALALSPSELFSAAECARANENNADASSVSWQCSYGCGKVYRKSSGRSIRRHVVSCFRQHWPGGADLSEKELSALIAAQQDRGLLVTGLRRWRMRQSRRAAHELGENEKWRCPWGCGKYYRSTSSRSIQRHATTCPSRQSGAHGHAAMTASTKSGAAASARGEETEEEAALTARMSRTRRATLRAAATPLKPAAWDTAAAGGRAWKLKVDVSTTSPSSSTPDPTRAFAGHSPPKDVDYLYPDSASAASTPLSTSSNASYTSLSLQKREVTLQLQSLLRDLYSRYGLNHPVFSSPMITPDQVQRLLNGDPDEDGYESPMKVEPVDPAATNEPLRPRRGRGVVVAGDSPFQWTCACGVSFKITSSKSIQKHRATCPVHRAAHGDDDDVVQRSASERRANERGDVQTS